MPTRIPVPTRSIPSTSTSSARAASETPASTTTTTTTAADPASTVPVDARAAANSFESGTRGDFVANQGASAPAGATSLLNARLGQMTGGSALERMTALVPPAAELARGPADKLVDLIKTQLAKARSEGDDYARLDTGDLDAILQPAGSSVALGYDVVVKALEEVGYNASADGFIGVSIEVPKDAIAKAKPEAFLAELATKFPPAPTAADKVDALGQLVARKLEAALVAGENGVTLEPDELDGAVGDGGPSYVSIVKQLKALGYQASADGFLGVSVGWKNSATSAPTEAELQGAFAKLSATQSGSAADGVAALFERKRAEADDTSVSLKPDDLDPLLEPVFGEGYGGYQPLADALAKLGYQTFADGFMGVSVSWGE